MADRTLLQTLTREASFVPASWNAERRTMDIVWSRGARVRRREFDWDRWRYVEYDEELSLDPAHINLDRLNNGAPYLAVHDGSSLDNVLGKIVEGSARIENGEGVAQVVFSGRAAVQPVIDDIVSGIMRKSSVGYNVYRWQTTQQENGRELRLAIDWEVFEVSQVPMAADDDAGTRNFPPMEAWPPHLREVIMSKLAEPGKVPETGAADKGRGAGDDGGAQAQAQIDAAVQAELGRRTTIDELARLLRVGDPDLVKRLQNDRVPLDGPEGARAQLQRVAAKASDDLGINGQRASGGDLDEQKTKRDGLRDALAYRVRPRDVQVTDPMRRYMGRSFVEICRTVLADAGQRSDDLGKIEIVQRALQLRSVGAHTTSDLPGLLTEVGNRSLLRGFELAAPTYQRIARRVSASDFRDLTRYQLHGSIEPEETNEAGDYESTTLLESKESFRVKNRGRLISFSLEAMVNDDLDALGRIPQIMGAGSASKRNKIVWDLVTAGKMKSDGKTIFHADHGNLLDPAVPLSASDPSSLGSALEQLGLFEDAAGNLIRVQGAIIAVPFALKFTVGQLLAQSTPAKQGDAVPDELKTLIPVAEPLLDGNSKKSWYVFGDPEVTVDGLEYAELDGYEGPQLAEEERFQSGAMVWRVQDFFGAGAVGYRFAIKSTGTAI